MLVLYLLGEQQQALAVPRPSDLDRQHALWDYRWSLVRALAAATEGEFHAALAHHTGDHHRASEILATFRGNVRSPASFAVDAHYRDLLRARLSKPERAAILERAKDRDPAEVLDRELARTSGSDRA